MTEAETTYWKNKLVSVSHVFQFSSPTTEEMRKARYMELANVRDVFHEERPPLIPCLAVPETAP